MVIEQSNEKLRILRWLSYIYLYLRKVIFIDFNDEVNSILAQSIGFFLICSAQFDTWPIRDELTKKPAILNATEFRTYLALLLESDLLPGHLNRSRDFLFKISFPILSRIFWVIFFFTSSNALRLSSVIALFGVKYLKKKKLQQVLCKISLSAAAQKQFTIYKPLHNFRVTAI